MQSDESRQGVLAAANSNRAPVKTTLAAANVNFATAKNLRINWKPEQPEPTSCSEKGFSLQRINTVLTYWNTKP